MVTRRVALSVGVDFYSRISMLHSCVNNATAVHKILGRHGDTGKKNFETKLRAASDPKSAITRGELKDFVADLLAEELEVALFSLPATAISKQLAATFAPVNVIVATTDWRWVK
jgi:hypothetical protein